MSRHCVFNFVTHYLHTYRHISSVWLLRACMRLWFMVFRPLDIHLDWVGLQVDIVNAFNSISCKAIFQEFQATWNQLSQLFPFVCVFYALESPLFFSHHSLLRDLFILLSSIGMHQVDPFVKPFIALAHFHVLCCFLKVFPSCFFPSLAIWHSHP